MQEPSEDKSKQNRRDIHEFSEKVSQIVDTFENLRFWTKKVSQIVETFEKMILKVKKTDAFLKVTCRKCDRGLNQTPSEAKSKQNRRGIHEFSEKVSQIADTLENLRFWTKK